MVITSKVLGSNQRPAHAARHLQLLALSDQGVDRFNSIVTDHRTELLHHLLDERITVDRFLRLALTVGAAA
jgi:hypothetical protein